MRNGDSFDVQPAVDAGALSFNFMNITADPGFQIRTISCGHQGNLCMLINPFPISRVSAFQSLATKTLTVAKDDASQPAITSAPAGIDCGVDCTEIYSTNDVITLTAGLKPGFTLDFWATGPGQGPNLTGNPLVVTMDRSWTLTAFYKEDITVIGDGRAKIVSQTSDIVVVEAIPAPNNYLVGIICPP